ncbi:MULTISPECIES: CD1375 family protein [Megasphaera]|nr:MULTISPECIES: CD1375 family protein [Megasphaera]
MIKAWLVSAYSKLVILGKYTLDEKETDKILVPELYQAAVAEWLVAREV